MKVNPLYVVALKEEVDTEFIDKFDVLITGVGKVNAAYELTRHLAENKNIYNLVINFGTAGSNYLDPGTFVDCTRFYEKDMDCLPLGFEPFQTPFEKEIIIDFNLESIFNPLNKNLSCYTGDKFVTEDLDYQGIFDMEAYALAKVCKSFQLPFISFKYISDGANSDSSGDWTENISSGYKIFYQKVVREILNYKLNQ
tara:strand:+ start:1840 stop:2430 length:591 start_codon:yes stop_codon:yes gene_type:complete